MHLFFFFYGIKFKNGIYLAPFHNKRGKIKLKKKKKIINQYYVIYNNKLKLNVYLFDSITVIKTLLI